MAPSGPYPLVPPPPGRPAGRAAAAARAAAAFYRGWRSGVPDTNAVEIERQRQQIRHESALVEYRRRAAALRTRLIAGGTAAVGGAAVMASTLDSLAADAPLAVLGGSALAVGAWQAIVGRKGLTAITEPTPPPAIPPVPVPLPPGSVGAEPAARMAGLRVHVMELLPTVEMLHPSAADEIRAADAATAPGMNALVERIRSMQRIIYQMPGTPAAQSARLSIDAMTIRLNEGASAYQELLAAVITLSTAPAITGGPTATLQPAIADMASYAAGLQAAARTWQP